MSIRSLLKCLSHSCLNLEVRGKRGLISCYLLAVNAKRGDVKSLDFKVKGTYTWRQLETDHYWYIFHVFSSGIYTSLGYIYLYATLPIQSLVLLPLKSVEVLL